MVYGDPGTNQKLVFDLADVSLSLTLALSDDIWSYLSFVWSCSNWCKTSANLAEEKLSFFSKSSFFIHYNQDISKPSICQLIHHQLLLYFLHDPFHNICCVMVKIPALTDENIQIMMIWYIVYSADCCWHHKIPILSQYKL